jgi:hypothetical protein
MGKKCRSESQSLLGIAIIEPNHPSPSIPLPVEGRGRFVATRSVPQKRFLKIFDRSEPLGTYLGYED